MPRELRELVRCRPNSSNKTAKNSFCSHLCIGFGFSRTGDGHSINQIHSNELTSKEAEDLCHTNEQTVNNVTTYVMILYAKLHILSSVDTRHTIHHSAKWRRNINSHQIAFGLANKHTKNAHARMESSNSSGNTLVSDKNWREKM